MENSSIFLFGELLLQQAGVQSKERREEMLISAYQKLQNLMLMNKEMALASSVWLMPKGAARN